MTHSHEEKDGSLNGLVRRIRFVDEDRISIDGQERQLSARMNRFMTVRPGYPAIVGRLAQMLYDQHYTQPDDGRGAYRFVFDRLLRQEYLEHIATANRTIDSWQTGWLLVREEAEGRVAIKDARGRERLVAKQDFEATSEGAEGRLRVPRGSAVMQQGWFHVRGSEDHGMSGPGTLRIYFNISRAGAVPLVTIITESFNQAKVPFHFKISDEPQAFRRADGAVLYFAAKHWETAQPALQSVYEAVGRYLKAPTPLFSHRLAPGMGLAEDPDSGESFGMHRCRLLSEGLWQSKAAGLQTDEEIRDHVVNHFAQAGYDWSKPYLNPGSHADYAIVLPLVRRVSLAPTEVTA